MTSRYFLRVSIFVLPWLFSSLHARSQTSWAETLRSGEGTITVFWYESRPFIFKDAGGQMQGLEPELLEDFQRFLKTNHNVNLTIEWKEATSFKNTYESIRDLQIEGIFGASAFSITPERDKEVDFAPPYMSDICVMITSRSVPIVNLLENFDEVFSSLTAVTIEGTTYEQDILQLKEERNLPFPIDYIPSSENILRALERRDSAFAFIDLPVYLMMFSNDPFIAVNRQNLFPSRREGYSFILPENSDWSVPLEEYFNIPSFEGTFEAITSNYFDPDLYRFIENLPQRPNNNIELLTREKEIQYQNLLTKTEQILQDSKTKTFLIALAAGILICFFVIFILYRKRVQQNQKILDQQKNIESKKLQLEERNMHLVSLDEEKNNLIKILAHDLRTPINHVQGLAQVLMLNKDSFDDDQKTMIRTISDASIRLNKMITSILDIDALENNRVKLFTEKVLVTPLAQQVIESFEKLASIKNIELTFQTNQEAALIAADSLYFIQILENLLSNAIKFSPHGKTVAISIHEMDQDIVIKIQDHGPGLNVEDHQKLFRKFQPLSAKPTGGESSTGLGLSIVKKYVEMMNGKVWCESEPGNGATFCIAFSKVLQEEITA